jgi:hypothetical protein
MPDADTNAPGSGACPPPRDPFEAWHVPVLEPAQFLALGDGKGLSRDQFEYLARFGLLAPTTHNTVPERFERSSDGAMRIWLDRRLVLRESDADGRQAAVSVGCVITNVEGAARSLGLEARVDVEATPLAQTRPAVSHEANLVPMATLHFSPRAPHPTAPALLNAMRTRKMVRAEFDGTALPDQTLAGLRAEISAHPGLELHLVRDATTLLFLGKFQELADSTVVNREGFARELGDWLLENQAPHDRGMRGREFGLSDEATRRFSLGLRGELQLLPDEIAGFARASNIGIRSASAVGVIAVERDDLALRIAAGRAFEACALRLLLEGFVVSMHAGLTEVEVPNLALRGRLRTRHRPAVVFRIGRVRRAHEGDRPHSSRPALVDVLL